MSRRYKKSAFKLRNIYAIWMGILTVFVLHMIVSITDEHFIESTLEIYTEKVYSYKRSDHNREIRSERHVHNGATTPERYVTVERNISNVEDSQPDNGLASEQANTTSGHTNQTNVRRKLRGLFGKQDEVQSIREDYYKNESRPESCDNCFPTNFTYISSSVCNKTGSPDKVDIIIVIPTAYTNIRQRMALRTTWLSRTMKNSAKVRYMFILGRTDIKQMQNAVLKEQATYNDIVVANFTDTYMNLTLKTLAAFHWVRSWCSQARVVVKADDDVFMNLENLIIFSGRNLGPMQNSVYGGCWVKTPIRRPGSKYYVSNTTYSNETYPEVCAGTTYVTSAKVVEKILRISPDTPFFYLEDVYVAFCMKKLGIKAKRHLGILTRVIKSEIPLCAYKGNRLISAHIRNPRKIEQIWREKCDKKKPLEPK